MVLYLACGKHGSEMTVIWDVKVCNLVSVDVSEDSDTSILWVQ
jgi:hypothetical protein